MLFSLPIGTILSYTFSICLIISCLNKLTISIVLFSIICVPVFSTAISFMLSSFLMHSKKFTNYLIKKYQMLNEMNIKLNNLIVRDRVTKNNLINLESKKEEITNQIINNDDLIESKKRDVSKLKEDYFNFVINDPNSRNVMHIVCSTGKKRTKTIGNVNHYKDSNN